MKHPIAQTAILGSLALGVGCQSTSSTAPSAAGADQNATADSIAQTTPDATEPTAVVWIKGLACPYCVQNIDRQLVGLPGVDAVHVDLPTGKVTIALTPESPASRQALVDAIDNSGFTLDRLEMPGR